MKKILTIILTFLMAIFAVGMLACGSNEKNKVELTLENYQEYLSIYEGTPTYNTSKQYDSNLGIYRYNGNASAIIEVSSMNQQNDFENVVIEFTIIGWGGVCDYELKLNAKGEAKKNISTTVSNTLRDPSSDLSSYVFRINSISGYVITYN